MNRSWKHSTATSRWEARSWDDTRLAAPSEHHSRPRQTMRNEFGLHCLAGGVGRCALGYWVIWCMDVKGVQVNLDSACMHKIETYPNLPATPSDSA